MNRVQVKCARTTLALAMAAIFTNVPAFAGVTTTAVTSSKSVPASRVSLSEALLTEVLLTEPLEMVSDGSSRLGTEMRPEMPPEVISEALPRVLSINLCADQMVMLLADAKQITALSRLSHDEAGSYFHEKARNFPLAEPRAEDIMPRDPDVVVTGPFNSRYTMTLLDELGMNVQSLEIADSVDAMLANMRRVGEMLHQQERAETAISALKNRLASIDARVSVLNESLTEKGSELPRVAVYDANGYTVGPKSLRGEAMTRAGFHNVAIDLGIESYGVLQLEDMIRLAPEVLIESPYSRDTYSRGQMVAEHPALRQAGLNPMVVSLPSNQTICAGPWIVEVIEQLLEVREGLQQGVP